MLMDVVVTKVDTDGHLFMYLKENIIKIIKKKKKELISMLFINIRLCIQPFITQDLIDFQTTFIYKYMLTECFIKFKTMTFIFMHECENI